MRESTLFAAVINEEVNFHIMKVLNDPFPLLMMATSVDCPVVSEIIVRDVIQRRSRSRLYPSNNYLYAIRLRGRRERRNMGEDRRTCKACTHVKLAIKA